jgi:hypothetical protein
VVIIRFALNPSSAVYSVSVLATMCSYQIPMFALVSWQAGSNASVLAGADRTTVTRAPPAGLRRQSAAVPCQTVHIRTRSTAEKSYARLSLALVEGPPYRESRYGSRQIAVWQSERTAVQFLFRTFCIQQCTVHCGGLCEEPWFIRLVINLVYAHATDGVQWCTFQQYEVSACPLGVRITQ